MDTSAAHSTATGFTGQPVPPGDLLVLGTVRQSGGKLVTHANEGMRQMPISLKLVAALSVLAEATAAALVFWHTGPRAR